MQRVSTDEKYLGEYHDALSELVGIVGSEEFENEAARVHELIRPYMAKDPKAFYTPDEFEKAYTTMREITALRAESVRRQLDGRLASITEQQAEADRVDASGISVTDMGMLVKPSHARKWGASL